MGTNMKVEAAAGSNINDYCAKSWQKANQIQTCCLGPSVSYVTFLNVKSRTTPQASQQNLK
jgi:hypothetical protein